MFLTIEFTRMKVLLSFDVSAIYLQISIGFQKIVNLDLLNFAHAN